MTAPRFPELPDPFGWLEAELTRLAGLITPELDAPERVELQGQIADLTWHRDRLRADTDARDRLQAQIAADHRAWQDSPPGPARDRVLARWQRAALRADVLQGAIRVHLKALDALAARGSE